MQWHIHQNGSNAGPFSESDLVAQIKIGKLPSDVLVWREGMSEWKPAHSVLSNPMSTPPQVSQVQSPSVVQVTASPASAVVQVTASPKSVIVASWVLLLLSCLGSMVPGLGFGVWLIIMPILLVTFILGILAIARGGVFQGILILGATLIVVPIFVFIAPFVSTGSAIAEASKNLSEHPSQGP